MTLLATARAYGEPKGQPRPRAFARGGSARVYDPGTAENWKSAVAEAFREHRGRLIEGPVRCVIYLFFPRPKSHMGKRGLKPSAPRHYTKKPDPDNAAKAVLDALSEKSGIGVWKDDAQVVDLDVRKRWADVGQQAGARIEIYAI